MELSTVLGLLLFLAGLINIYFYFPTKKLHACFKTKPTSSTAATTVKKSTDEELKKASTVKKSDIELKRVFSTFDKDGDGFITKEELRLSLKNIKIFMSEREVEETVAKMDGNGDGLIELDEFCELFDSMEGGGGGEADLKEAFDVFDEDKDGLISVEELGLVLSGLGLSEGKKMEACREMIRKVDLDGDGMVNFDEFKMMMMKSEDGSLVSAS